MSVEAQTALAEARDLYLALGEADAAASRELLLERTGDASDERARYDEHLREAGVQLTAIAQDFGDSQRIRHAVEGITTDLSKYSAYVEAARVNSRQGYPVAAGYLRTASELMRDHILAAAGLVYVAAMEQVDASGAAASRPVHVSMIATAGVVTIVLLLVVQIIVALRTRRVLNLGLVVASVLVAVMLGSVFSRFATMRGDLDAAQHSGQMEMESLSAARILALRAQRADAGRLIERSADDGAFTELAERIGGSAGLIHAAGDRHRIESSFARFISAHESVQHSDEAGLHPYAVQLFQTAELTGAEELDSQLGSAIDAAEHRFAQHSAAAIDEVDGLASATLLLALLAVAAGLVGLAPRIREYR